MFALPAPAQLGAKRVLRRQRPRLARRALGLICCRNRVQRVSEDVCRARGFQVLMRRAVELVSVPQQVSKNIQGHPQLHSRPGRYRRRGEISYLYPFVL